MLMAQYPGLTIWTDAYLADTSHLTTLEHGAYLLLLFAAWRSEKCSLPNDDKLLARYARMRVDNWMKIKPIILEFFDIEDDRLIQGRLQDEKSYVSQKSNVGRKAAKARWLKTKETGDANASKTQSEGNTPTPTPTPNKKELKEKEELSEVFEFYNSVASALGLSISKMLSDKNEKVLRHRIKKAGGIDVMKEAIRSMGESDFLMGRIPGKMYNGKRAASFKMTLTRLCGTEEFFEKFINGDYIDKKPPPKKKTKTDGITIPKRD